MTGIPRTSPSKPPPTPAAPPSNTAPATGPASEPAPSKPWSISPDADPSEQPPARIAIPSVDVLTPAQKLAIQSGGADPSRFGPRGAQPQYDWTKMPSTARAAPKLDERWWDPPVASLTRQPAKDMARLAKPLSRVTSVVGVDEDKLRGALRKAPKAAVEAGLKKATDAAVQPARDASVGPRNPTDLPPEIGTYQSFPIPPIKVEW